MNRVIKYTLAVILLGAIALGLLLGFSPKFKKAAEIKALDKIGDIATKRMSENPEAKGSVAAEFINIPVIRMSSERRAKT